MARVRKKKLFLVDGSNHAFRVQFALPPRHSSDGQPTRVLYGFTLLFQKMMRTWRPDWCVVSFDHGKTFRHGIFEEYKGHRPEMPQDMKRQWQLLPPLVEAFGYTCIIKDGYEADDVLGTLAKQFASDEVQAYLVTSDKDFAQLVDPNITLLDERKDELIDAAKVHEKFGVRPDQIIDMLGLAGDTSDNLPGVPGIGMKTAARLLDQHGSLEDILAAAEAGTIKGKRGSNLIEHADNARMSAMLATIETAVPLGELKLEDFAPSGVKEQPLRDMFDAWEFGMVARKLLPKRIAVDVSIYEALTTSEQLDAAIAAAREAGKVCLDLELMGNELVACGMSWSPTDAVYVPLARQGLSTAGIVALLEDEGVAKIFENSKAAWAFAVANDFTIRNVLGDTRLLDYVLVAHRRSHGIDHLAQQHLGHNLSYQSAQAQLSLDQAARFGAEPAHVTFLVHDKLLKRLADEPGHVYRNIELPLVKVVAEMEAHGIRLDEERLREIRTDIAHRVELAEKRCHTLAGRTFKVGSTKEVAKVLFEELGLPPGKKTRTGFSTDSKVLESLSDQHELPEALLEWRQLSKLDSTYLSKLPGYVAADGRIHSTINQAGATTGRFSSADPNLQNIPIRTYEGRRIREAFVPDPGHLFLSADYSQVELRVLAHFTGCTTLVESFRAGEDIHRRTAAEVFQVPMDEVTSEQRSAAKAVNFGLVYGMSAFRLGRDLHISRDDAQQYMDDYFARLPEVEEWLETTRQQCRQDGYVETLYGRRRLIPEIYSKTFSERKMGEREAVNTRVQGTAADIMKIAMIKVHDAIEASPLSARLILTVHDELLLEVPADEVEAASALLVEQMVNAAPELSVPLKVNVATGETWEAAHG